MPRMSDTTTFADCLRELDVAGQVAEFDTDVPTAAAAAEQLGCELGAIANSLIFTVDDAPLLIIASGAHWVDTKRVARLLGAREIRRANPEFVLTVTGQPVADVGPVGHPQPRRVARARAPRSCPPAERSPCTSVVRADRSSGR